MGPQINIAIIGTGHMASVYRDAISANLDARLCMICGSDVDRARSLVNDPTIMATTRLEQVLDSPDVDAIIVANQPQRHGVAVDAIRVGKHVLVEKPLAATLDDASAILEASSASAAVVSGVFQMRFGRDVERLRELIASGRIGNPRAIDSIWFDQRPLDYYRAGGGWRLGRCGGLILNRLVHHIDLMRSLVGEVRSVFAITRPSAASAAIDAEATIVLEFADALTGVIRGSDAIGPVTMLTMYGDRGTIRLRDGEVLSCDDAAADDLLPGRKANLRRAFGLGRECTRLAPGNTRDQVADFLAAILGGGRPRVTIEDSYRALVIALAAHESAATGRAVDVRAGNVPGVP